MLMSAQMPYSAGSLPRKPRIGLALGSGSARGWAHIGVIRALERAGIRPDIICGTSIGALVGAIYAAGELDRFEKWLLGLGVREMVSYMDVQLGGGLLRGERLMDFLRRNFVDRPVDALDIPFAAVATALQTGEEVWLREGSTLEAVRASISLPGLFTPTLVDGRMLVDGGLVNPVPVSLARAMGADVLIAVDLSADMLGRYFHNEPVRPPQTLSAPAPEGWLRKLQHGLGAWLPGTAAPKPGETSPRMPSILDVMASSINVMQVRITRSRMAGDPPDLIITPRLSHLGLLEFHRAAEAIEEGHRAVERIAHVLPGLCATPEGR